MIVALVLAGYAVAVAGAGARWLRGAPWARRAPRLGIAAWQALTITTVASAALAGLALAVPTVRVSANLAGLLHACVSALRAQYATPGGAATGLAGAALAAGILGRLAWCAGASLAGAARGRACHYDALALVARRHDVPGVLLLDHDGPAAYCLPGRRQRIVVTAGALRQLDNAQLDAVLAHERAHLAGRHHLVVAFAQALARSFPRVALFATAARETAELVEMAADDAASRQAGRIVLAGALLALAAARVPADALGAGGGTAQRVRRLAEAPQPLSQFRLAAAGAATALALAVPALAFAGPAAAIIGMAYCPVAPLS